MNGVLKTSAVVLMVILLVMSSALLVYSRTFVPPETTELDETKTTAEVESTVAVPIDTPSHDKFDSETITGGDPFCEHSWLTEIEILPPGVGTMGETMSYCYNCRAVRVKKIEPISDPNGRFKLDVKNILQNPELPNGCEIVSLAIVLNYLGFDVNAVELSDKYLEKGEFFIDSPYEKYIGDPKTETGTGCYAPCIVKAANTFFKDSKSEYKCVDVSGKKLEDFEKYIDKGIPVIIWGTVFMDCDPSVCYSCWSDFANSFVNWYMHSHCLVMIGYSNTTYIFADPLYGISDYTKEDVKKSYEQEYCQACIIK